jgi:hypothetical protein
LSASPSTNWYIACRAARLAEVEETAGRAPVQPQPQHHRSQAGPRRLARSRTTTARQPGRPRCCGIGRRFGLCAKDRYFQGGLIWAAYAAVLGYFGGKAFEHMPWAGLILALAIAFAVTGAVVGRRYAQRHRRSRQPDEPPEDSA